MTPSKINEDTSKLHLDNCFGVDKITSWLVELIEIKHEEEIIGSVSVVEMIQKKMRSPVERRRRRSLEA